MSDDKLVAYQQGRNDGLLELHMEIARLKNVTTAQYQLITKLREEIELLETERDNLRNDCIEWELDYRSLQHAADLLMIATKEIPNDSK